LLDGLAEAVELRAAAGCERLWLNGSSSPQRTSPAISTRAGTDLDVLDEVILDLSSGRARQKARFGGELFPNVVESGSGSSSPTSSRTSEMAAARASSSY
jgi:hypothetical protein